MNTIKTLKGFNDSENGGRYVRRGSPIEVTPQRHAALSRSGILPPPEGKAAAEPENKMADEHGNKSVTNDRITNKRRAEKPAPDQGE